MNLANDRKRTLFICLGRRGALPQLALEVARAAPERAVLVVSKQSELFAEIAAAGAPAVGVDTFDSGRGALVNLHRLPALRRRVIDTIREYNIDAAIVLMSHVWTPLIAPAIRRAGVRYTVIVHDADPHPGDLTALVNRWLHRDARQADRVVTLSEHVANRLIERRIVPAERVRTLFHPILDVDGKSAPHARRSDGPIAFLFFGRIMSYKGLPLFAEACEILRREGLSFSIGVVGEGDISASRTRLERLGAEIINRWVARDEIAAIMRRYDAVVAPSTEASQSGVVASAHGRGLPVIVTPVGGLPDQVENGITGLVASSVSAEAVADRMRRFIVDPTLRGQLYAAVQARRDSMSMARFVDALLAEAGAAR